MRPSSTSARRTCPTSPTSTSPRWSAGIDVLLFRPDAELRRLARLAIENGVDGAFAEGRTPRRSRPSSPRATPGEPGWPSSRRSRTRGSTWPPATASTTTTAAGSTIRASPTPRSIGHINASAGRRADRAPHRGDRARARPPRRGVRRAARPRRAAALQRPARPVADGLPLRRGAQVLLRLLVPHPLVEQGARVRRAAGRRTASSRTRRTSSSSGATRWRSALDELVLSWATGGQPLGPQALAADRGAAQGAAREARANGRRRRRSAWRPRRSPTR